MSRADGKRKRAVQARKAERERVRDERKQAKLEKRTGAAVAAEPGTVPDPVRQGLLRAVDAVVATGGVVLVGHTGQPFAFYPAHAGVLAQDPGAPERLREILGRRLEERG